MRPRPTRILPLETSTLKQKCHPDRSAAQWRDLLFIIPFAKPNGCAAPTFVIPRDLRCAPGPPEFSLWKPQPSNRSVIPTGAQRSAGTCCSPSHSQSRMDAQPQPLSSRPKWRDLRCAPRPTRILPLKPQPSNRSVIPTGAQRRELSRKECDLAPISSPPSQIQTWSQLLRLVGLVSPY